MLKFKTILIVAVIFSLFLLSFVSKSDAIEIIKMESSMGYEIVGPAPYINAFVETDEPYYAVDWFVDGVYHISFGDGNKKVASFYAFFPTASIRGSWHEVKAIAYTMDPDNPPQSDIESIWIKVYKSVETYATPNNGVVGIWAAIDRHFYQTGEIIATHRGSTYSFPDGLSFFYRFKREVTRPDGLNIEMLPREGLIVASTHYTEHSEDFPVDIRGRGTGDFESWAYTRIEAGGAGATATSTETFFHFDD
jgi:hypothetical protein